MLSTAVTALCGFFFWLIGILTVVFAVAIAFSPSGMARTILELPLLLLFPGYTSQAALFPEKGRQAGWNAWL